MQKLRIAMAGCGILASFIAVGMAEAEMLLGCNNRSSIAALVVFAAAMVAPLIIHFYNTGRA